MINQTCKLRLGLEFTKLAKGDKTGSDWFGGIHWFKYKKSNFIIKISKN
jgi:hypothetical protein